MVTVRGLKKCEGHIFLGELSPGKSASSIIRPTAFTSKLCPDRLPVSSDSSAVHLRQGKLADGFAARSISSLRSAGYTGRRDQFDVSQYVQAIDPQPDAGRRMPGIGVGGRHM